VESEAELAKTFADTEALMTDTYLTKDGEMGRVSQNGGVMPEGAKVGAHRRRRGSGKG
jgi:hypothetical protein